MVLNLFIDTIRLSEVYHFEEFSNQNKIDRIVSYDLAAVICSDLKISLKSFTIFSHAYQINY